MTKYACLRCTGTIDADSKEEAIRRLDHAVGTSKGRPCAGGKGAPIYEVKEKATVAPPREEKPKSEKAESKKSKSSEK